VFALTSCSVPATYASFPILHQLFARLGLDDNIETNVSTFAAEMKEIAFILRNIDRRSLLVDSHIIFEYEYVFIDAGPS
jgi:DNA mismatch repair protein MSH4